MFPFLPVKSGSLIVAWKDRIIVFLFFDDTVTCNRHLINSVNCHLQQFNMYVYQYILIAKEYQYRFWNENTFRTEHVSVPLLLEMLNQCRTDIQVWFVITENINKPTGNIELNIHASYTVIYIVYSYETWFL